MSSHSSHHCQEVLIAHFSLYVNNWVALNPSHSFIDFLINLCTVPCLQQKITLMSVNHILVTFREGHGTMVAITLTTACYVGSIPAWWGLNVFREVAYISPFSALGHWSDVVSVGKALQPHSGVNEYLEGQRWQYVRKVPSRWVVCSPGS